MSLPQTRSESRSLVNGRPDRQAVPARGVPSVRSLRNLHCTLCRMNLNIPQDGEKPVEDVSVYFVGPSKDRLESTTV